MIRLSKSSINNSDILNVKRTLQKEFLGMGQEVRHFEKKLSKYLSNNTACVSSGTAALHLALQAINIKKGDEVLVPSLTYAACFQVIKATGAKPIPIEINLSDLNFSIKDIKKKINKKTKCIMPVHYAGSVGQLDKLYTLAKKKNIRIIEDASHAFGTIYKKKKVGSFGDIICFSFDGIKNLTSGEGGCVVSKDKKIIEKVRVARFLGIKKETEKRFKNIKGYEFKIETQGWRYHMSNIMAAIGISQIKRFNLIMKKRREIAKYYVKKLNLAKGIEILNYNYDEVVPHIFVIKILNMNNFKRQNIIKYLKSKKIETGIHWKPNHMIRFFCKNKFYLPNTEKAYKQILTLPLHVDLKKTDIDKVIEYLKIAIKKYI